MTPCPLVGGEFGGPSASDGVLALVTSALTFLAVLALVAVLV